MRYAWGGFSKISSTIVILVGFGDFGDYRPGTANGFAIDCSSERLDLPFRTFRDGSNLYIRPSRSTKNGSS